MNIFLIIFWFNAFRSQCVSLLSRLHWLNKKQFRSFMKDLVDNQSIIFLLSFFHSYLGFCSEINNAFSPNPAIIPISRKRSPSRMGPDLSPVSYSNNFGENSGNENYKWEYSMFKAWNKGRHFCRIQSQRPKWSECASVLFAHSLEWKSN